MKGNPVLNGVRDDFGYRAGEDSGDLRGKNASYGTKRSQTRSVKH
jgi:hypothetical protein